MRKQISPKTARTVMYILSMCVIMLGPYTYLTSNLIDETFSAIIAGVISSIGILSAGMTATTEPKKSDTILEKVNAKIDRLQKDMDEIKKNHRISVL